LIYEFYEGLNNLSTVISKERIFMRKNMLSIFLVCVLSCSLVIPGMVSDADAKKAKKTTEEKAIEKAEKDALKARLNDPEIKEALKKLRGKRLSLAVYDLQLVAAGLQQETVDLRAEIDAINLDISTLEAGVSNNDQAIATLNDLLDILRNDLDSTTQDLNAKIAQLRSDLEAQLAQTQADLLAARQNLQAQLDQTNAELLTVQHDLDAEIALVADALAATKQALEQQIANIDNRLAGVDGQLAQLNSGLGDAKAEILVLFGLVQALEDQHRVDIAFIQLQVDGLNLQIGDLATDLALEAAQLQAAIDANSIDISGLLVNVSSLTAQIVLLDNQVDNHESRLTSLEGSLVVVQNTLADLEDRVDRIDQSVSALEEIHNPAIVYSADFVRGATYSNSSIQTQDWNQFRSEATGSFSSIEISNSLGGSVICSDATIATNIAASLHNQSTFDPDSVFSCQGVNWVIGRCGSALELAAGQSRACRCGQHASVRPNIGNWGGVGSQFGGSGDTCFAPTQTIEVMLTK
jgi:chromosome segregation ATPase